MTGRVVVLERPYIEMVAYGDRFRLMLPEAAYKRACDAHRKGEDLTLEVGRDALIVPPWEGADD